MAAQRLLRRATRATPRCAPCWPQNWWAVALRGVFGILFGLIALVWPVATMLSLALLFAAYLLADGVFGIVAAVRAAQANERWGLLLAEGGLNIVMGVIAALFPGAALFAFVIITAAWALVSGGLMLAAAFKLTREHGRWLLALGGVVSIIYGLLLISAPLFGVSCPDLVARSLRTRLWSDLARSRVPLARAEEPAHGRRPGPAAERVIEPISAKSLAQPRTPRRCLAS